MQQLNCYLGAECQLYGNINELLRERAGSVIPHADDDVMCVMKNWRVANIAHCA
jgi:hypothetical protein